MAYTESELKTELLTLIPATLQAEAAGFWDGWYREASGGQNRDLALRVRVLTYLQGKLYVRYNVQTGRDRRESFQQWQAVTKMLETAQGLLDDAGGTTGVAQSYAGVTNLRPKSLVTNCSSPRFRHGKGHR